MAASRKFKLVGGGIGPITTVGRGPGLYHAQHGSIGIIKTTETQIVQQCVPEPSIGYQLDTYYQGTYVAAWADTVVTCPTTEQRCCQAKSNDSFASHMHSLQQCEPVCLCRHYELGFVSGCTCGNGLCTCAEVWECHNPTTFPIQCR